MTEIFYIYFHTRPDTGDVFYVGRGKSYPRGCKMKRALVEADRNKAWKSVVEKNDGAFIVDIVEWFDTFEEAKMAEIGHILRIGLKRDGGTLVNQTYGGDGADGYKHTEEARAKLRAAWARSPSRKDQLRKESARRDHSNAPRGADHPWYGRKHSPETISIYREQRRGSKNGQARQVVNRKTGDVFGCVEDAARSVGLSRFTLYNYLSGKAKNTTSLEYK